MTNNVNGIGINSGSINPYIPQPKNEEAKVEKEKVTENAQPSVLPQVNPDAVFAYMSNVANINMPRTYDVNKYVSPESAARIAAMMSNFENSVAEGLLAIQAEGLPLSEADQLAIAAQMVD